MLETIDARTHVGELPLAVRGRDAAAWDYRTSAGGRASFSAPKADLPAGLSLVAFYADPDGGWRCRAEGNLTTLLYGDGTAVGSLDLDELEPATVAFREAVRGVVQGPVPPADEWDLHRLDPSRTVVLPDHVPASLVIEAAWQGWNLNKRTGQTLSRHNDETVTLRLAKHRSHSVYDKRAEALHKGSRFVRPDSPGLLRLEARVRPRLAQSADLRDWRPTLNLTPKDHEMINAENDLLTDALMSMVGATVLTQVRAFLRAGARPSEAVRLTTTVLLVAQYGDGVLEDLGVPRATAKRWRKEARDFLATQTEDDLIDDLPAVVRQAQSLRARDLAAGLEP